MPCNALPHNNQWPSTTRFSVTYIYSMRFSDAVCLYGKRNMQYRRQQPAGICENAFNGGPGKQNRWDTVIESRLPITICLDVTICGGRRFLICNLFFNTFCWIEVGIGENFGRCNQWISIYAERNNGIYELLFWSTEIETEILVHLKLYRKSIYVY